MRLRSLESSHRRPFQDDRMDQPQRVRSAPTAETPPPFGDPHELLRAELRRSPDGMAPDTLAQGARNLRTMIATARLTSDQAPRMIVLLSAEAEFETALLAANLAITSARSGWKTLLVDANTRHPVQPGLFGMQSLIADPPLDLLAGLAPFVQPSAVDDLYLLATQVSQHAGPGGSSAGGSGDDIDLPHLLRPLADDFDLVIVDGSHNSGDGTMTAGADAAIIVLLRDHSTTGGLKQMVSQLETQGTPLLGTFLVT